MANPLYDRLIARHRTTDARFLDYLGETWSYAAFADRAGRFAAVMGAAGLAAGDRLAVQVQKSPDALAVYAACLQTGIVFLPLNPAYTAAEIDYFLADSGARLMLCDPGRESDLREVADRHDVALETLGTGGEGSFAERAAQSTARAEVTPRAEEDLAAILYTSGTTGRSKGAMLTQRNLLSNARTLADIWRFSDRDVLLHALPIFHTHGLFVATNVVLEVGAAMLFLPKFDTDAVIAALPRATAMMGVPTFYTRLLNDPRLDREIVTGMRLFVSGSAPLLTATHEAFEARTGHRILERYGMTETNMNTSNPYEGARKPGTVGPPLPDVALRIVAPDSGAVLTEGEIGEIEVRGPNVFAGYWRMPDKTKAEFRDDGFFRTGDLGLVDGDGYVQIVGRAKDLVISGGYNVYPKEVEAVLDDAPGVLESAVIGIPHPDLGEGVVAVVVATPGHTPEAEAIQRHARAHLAAYKCPRAVEIVEALPRNAMGKVQKAALRERFAQRFGAVP